MTVDEGGYTGALLMDLSKAFDCIDHELLIAKLHACGFTKKPLKLVVVICQKGDRESKLMVHLAHGRKFTKESHRDLS